MTARHSYPTDIFTKIKVISPIFLPNKSNNALLGGCSALLRSRFYRGYAPVETAAFKKEGHYHIDRSFIPKFSFRREIIKSFRLEIINHSATAVIFLSEKQQSIFSFTKWLVLRTHPIMDCPSARFSQRSSRFNRQRMPDISLVLIGSQMNHRQSFL